MRKIVVFSLRIISGIYGIFFISSTIAYIYTYWDGTKSVPGQIYYSNDTDMRTFRSKYENLCSNDSIPKYYISPYHGNEKKVLFIRNTHERGMECEFFSTKGQVLMSFAVDNQKPLKIFYYAIEIANNPNETIEDYRRGINDGSSFARDYKYITLFENEILHNIGYFKRDDKQGFVCWYSRFFWKHLFSILMIGIILYITVKKAQRKGDHGEG